MIHILNKGTLRNQYPVRRKTKNRRAALSSKRVLKQDTPEKKLEDSWLKKSHFGLIAIIVFAFTYYLSPLLPLSSLSTPSLPLNTLHELNLLATNLDRLLQEDSVYEDRIQNLLSRKYQGVTKLNFDRKLYSDGDAVSAGREISPDNLNQIGNMVNFQIPVGKDGYHGKLIVSQDISLLEKKIFWIRILISGSIALLLVAILVYKQTRRITDQVDILANTADLVVTKVVDNATPNVGETITYSISGGTDDTQFSIDATTGALSFTSVPDYEDPADSDRDNVYNIQITATDGTNSTDQVIAVTVKNENDNFPVCTSPNTANIDENTTIVFTVTARDA